MEIFNLHENFQKALQILPMTFHFVDSVIGKKVSSQNNIIISELKSEQFLIITGMYCKTYYVGIPICNEHHEQC